MAALLAGRSRSVSPLAHRCGSAAYTRIEKNSYQNKRSAFCAKIIVVTTSRPREGESPYTFGGIYEPAEAARYVAAALPGRERPLTSRRVLRWIRGGLVAPESRDTRGWQLTINFQDLVTSQVITLLREAGFSLQRVQAAERYYAKLFDVSQPFAHAAFWHAFPDILTKIDGQLLAGTRGGQYAFDFLAEHTEPVLSHLDFRHETGRPYVWRPSEGVSLKPDIQFGQPCIDGTRIPTSAIWSYVNAGDPLEFIAESYGVEVAKIERAARWERRLRTGIDLAAAA